MELYNLGLFPFPS